jgi:hypothetical protein
MDYKEECLMRFKVLAVASFLLLTISSALASAGGREAPDDRGGILQINPISGAGDTTTGPTKPDSQVPSPGWV